MIYTKRIGIFLVFLLLVTSCQDTVITVSDESRDDARESYLLELWLDGEDLDILDLRIFDEPSRPFPASEATIAYEYRRLSGSVIEEGEVADPRLIRSEFDERGEVDVHFARVDYGLLRLKIPGVAGTLYFLDSDGEPFTQIDLDPVHHVREFPLMGPDDVLGDAVKIVDHGESIGRADILFLPDGYTEEDMGRFRDDVQEILRNLKVHPDYKPIWSDLNFWRQDVISQQRGINETGRFRDTAFEAGPVGDSGRCFVPGPRGKRAIQELAGKIRADYVVVLLNSQTHAGCASPFMTSQTVTPTAYLVLAHELGHGLFGLGDEYPYGGSVTGRCAVGRPNISSSSKAADIPWQALLTTDVLPTPDTEEYHRYVGAFEGAGYCERGRYRPSHTCLMRSRQEVMCAVCRHERDQYVIGLEQVRDAEEEHWRRREEQIGRQAAREERERRLEEYTLSEQERIDRCHHVQRIDGANMYATAANISQALFPNGASTVILATDQEFSTDAMAAGPLAASLGAPFMPVGRNSLSPYTKAEIERLGARKVIIVGGRISVTPLVTRELKKMGLEVERISGMTRFKTAREIAMELHKIQGSTSKSAFIVAADNISIRASITAGSLAAALNAPVLFVKHDSIPRSTARTLRELGIEHTYVVGGLGRINEAVFADLPGAERVNADTIYSLATTLATQAMDDELTDRSRFFIAHGDRPSDSVAASTGGHIILLTETERLNIFTRGFFEKHSRDTVILGDESVISENVRDELCEFLPPI